MYHTGSGKSTTIGMLTGAIAPTDGYIRILGKDVQSQMSSIRESMGICLQHNDCLFEKLTVRETLQLYCGIKGVYKRLTREQADKIVDKSILDIGLKEKSCTRVMHLSGGMKRKLCVAIAFCGDSKIILLDEPCSSMVR